MQLRSDTKIIDGVTFITTELPVMRGLVLGAKLGAIIAPMLVHIRTIDRAKMIRIINAFGKDDVKDVDVAVIGDVLEAIGPAAADAFAKLVTSVEQIAREMLVSTIAIVDGVKFDLTTEVAINAAFGGQLISLIKVLWWVGMVNFKKKFSEISASAGSAPTKDSR